MKALALMVLVGCNGSHEASSVDAASAPSCTWSPATELAEFGDGAIERDPTEPADLLELYFTSDASPGDILFANRASADAPFVMQPLPSFVAEGAIDMSPAISADGLRLMFVNDRGANAMVYETSRATRTSPWSTPQSVLSQWFVDVGAGITMSADGLKVFVQLSSDHVLYNFVRTTTDRPFAPGSDLIVAMLSPAVDDTDTAIYYNCGTSVCMRSLKSNGFDTTGDEQPVAMGTASGARDPWVEAGGNSVVFAAEHSLYRATKSCTP